MSDNPLLKTTEHEGHCVCENCGAKSKPVKHWKEPKGDDPLNEPQQRLYVRQAVIQHQDWRVQAGLLLCGSCATECMKMLRLAQGY
jgi:hypothetical protein